MNLAESKKLKSIINSTDKKLHIAGNKLLTKRLIVAALVFTAILAKPFYSPSIQSNMNETENHINRILDNFNNSVNKFSSQQLEKLNPYLINILKEKDQNVVMKNLAVSMFALEKSIRNNTLDLDNKDFLEKSKQESKKEEELKENKIKEIKNQLTVYTTKFKIIAKRDHFFKSKQHLDRIGENLFYKSIPIDESINYVKKNPSIEFETPPSINKIISYKIEEKNNKNNNLITLKEIKNKLTEEQNKNKQSEKFNNKNSWS